MQPLSTDLVKSIFILGYATQSRVFVDFAKLKTNGVAPSYRELPCPVQFFLYKRLWVFETSLSSPRCHLVLHSSLALCFLLVLSENN